MDIMAQRGRPKGSKNRSSNLMSSDVLCMQLDSIEAKLDKNSKDIEDLKHHVSMGRGGLKVLFIIGAVIAAIASAMGFMGGR